MMRYLLRAVLAAPLLLLFSYVAAGEYLGEKVGRISLVNEFIRELVVLDTLQQQAIKDLDENPSTTGQLMTAIRTAARTSYEMSASIVALEGLNVAGTSETYRDYLINLHRKRMAVYGEMNDISKKILAGPEEGVNYGALVARTPELTAMLENLDKTLFTISEALFLMLIDNDRIEKNGNLSHLIVTLQQRQQFIKQIERTFGARLGDNNKKYIVASAWAIDYGLKADTYKSSDQK